MYNTNKNMKIYQHILELEWA